MQTLITISGINLGNILIIIHLTISLNLVNLRCRCSVKFSLSGRDGDSNRFLSSWRGIPNTNPASPVRVAKQVTFGTTQEKNKRKDAGLGRPAFSENHSARKCRILSTWLSMDLCQWLSVHPYYLQNASNPHGSWPELSYSASRSERLIWPAKC